MAAQVGATNAIKVDWSPDAGIDQQVVVVIGDDTTDYCLSAPLLSATASTYTCTPSKAAAGATYVAVVIGLKPGGGFTLGNLPTVTLAAAQSGS